MAVPTADRRDRVALHLLQLGAVAVVLAAVPYKAFDLDRFFVPKELVLHLTAVLAGFVCWAGARRREVSRRDKLLAAFLGLSLLSALLSQNLWVATRATSMSISGVLLFWVGGRLRRAGLAWPLLTAIGIAVVIGALTGLIQAYAGPTTEYFSLNRAPGGTFGNRNFMAHLAAIGAPVVVMLAIAARTARGFALGSLASATLAAALVLSRSRAAWLGVVVAALVTLIAVWFAHASILTGRTNRRMRTLAIAMGIGALAAAFLPNRLEWKSESPYLDSVRGVVNYKEGSGAGRLVQYTNSLRMAGAHPILGVGPGNWAVAYPKYAAHNDQSLSSDEGMTDNPWPSSDWAAFLSERGPLATACLALAILLIVLRAFADLRRPADEDDADRPLLALMLIATTVTTVVVGAFDAVLLIAVPTMFFWMTAGVLSAPPDDDRAAPAVVARFGSLALALFGVLSIGRSAGEVAAMSSYSGAVKLTDVESAARFDPGNYRIQMRLADGYLARGQCAKAVDHAQAARHMFPNAVDPRAVLRRCGVRQ